MAPAIVPDLLAGVQRLPDGSPVTEQIYARVAPYLHRDVEDLAPGIQDSLNAALAELEQRGHPVTVIESMREEAVERAYFAIGRNRAGEIVRLASVVTRAQNGSQCQHCYRAAVDLSDVNSAVVNVMAKYGWASGSKWHHPDAPHFYPARMPAAPTAADIADYLAGDLGSVWARYSLGAE